MKVTVYNIKTGKPAEVEGIDAREYVKTGGWSYNPVSIEKVVEKEDTEEVILPRSKKK